MSEKNDQVEKKILLIDGEDLPGLIAIDEYIIEDDVVEIPGRDTTVSVRNGVKKVPPVPVTYKVTRDSATLKFYEDWYYKKEFHDVTLIRTDGAGNEFARELWPNTELSKLNAPAYDAAAPVAAQLLATLLPEDIIPLAAEG